MAAITWDIQGERVYETGVDRGVLYVQNNGVYGGGVAWNGLTAVNESPSGAEPTPLYADNIKYLNLMSAEEFSATIEAYTYPDEFADCDGLSEIADGVQIGQQNRKSFGFVYRTLVGNAQSGTEAGYKLHFVYGCLASPSEKAYATVNDSPEGVTFSWTINTTPVPVDGGKPTSTMTVDSRKVHKDKLKMLEDVLYGSSNAAPKLLLPNEVAALING